MPRLRRAHLETTTLYGRARQPPGYSPVKRTRRNDHAYFDQARREQPGYGAPTFEVRTRTESRSFSGSFIHCVRELEHHNDSSFAPRIQLGTRSMKTTRGINPCLINPNPNPNPYHELISPQNSSSRDQIHLRLAGSSIGLIPRGCTDATGGNFLGGFSFQP